MKDYNIFELLCNKCNNTKLESAGLNHCNSKAQRRTKSSLLIFGRLLLKLENNNFEISG